MVYASREMLACVNVHSMQENSIHVNQVSVANMLLQLLSS